MSVPPRKVIARPNATPPRPPAQTLPFLSIGFRPLFFFAALFAPLALITFIVQLTTGGDWPSHFSVIDWHRHEMLFGYTMAIIAGFLFTAVQNWTSQPTPKGAWLAVIVGLWATGRLAVLASSHMSVILALLLDLSFPVAVAIGIGRPLLKAKNQRNLFFLALLALIGGANGLTYLGFADLGYGLVLNVILFMIIVIGGRVIAMFTERPLGLILQRDSRLDIIIVQVSLLAFVSELIFLISAEAIPRPVPGLFFILAATANLWRLASWQPMKTRGHPLVWVLHSGYAWLIAGFSLKAAYFLGAEVPISVATHALTAGAIGVTTLGFISRVALGHTGRPLTVGSDMALAFILINMSAFVRVFIVGLWPDYSNTAYGVAAIMWCLAFLIFLFRYTPYLFNPRADAVSKG